MVGGLYGLFGLGLAFAFGIMRIVNIAHGEFIVLGAFIGASLLTATPLPLSAVVVLVSLASFAMGWLLQTVVLNRMIEPNPVPAMVATMGLSIIIRNALVSYYGADIRSIDVGPLQDQGIEVLGVSIMPVREAVSRLVADKALEVAANRAVRVPVMSSSQFRDLTKVRIAIEGHAAAEAARHRSDDDIMGIAAAARHRSDDDIM
eukprot:gene58159-79655_t